MIFYILIIVCAIISLASASGDTKPKFFKATPFITSSNSHFVPFIQGASIYKPGEAFATDFAGKAYKIGHIIPEQTLYHTSPKTTAYFNVLDFYR